MKTSSLSVSRRAALKMIGVAGGFALAAPAWLAAEGERPAPPSLAGAQAGYYRFRIGEMDAVALFDGGLTPPSTQSPFAIDEPGGSVEAALNAALLPPDRVQMPFNALVVRAGPELVLIDAGCGPHFGAAGGKMFAALAAVGVKPEHISGIILTHAHRDHFGGMLDAEKRPVFPNAKVFVTRKEHEFWMSSTPDLSGMAIPSEATKDFVVGAQEALGAYKGRLQLIAGGDRILQGFELLEAPGHTPGHLAVIIGSGNDQLLHLADVVHHHALSFTRPGWRFAYDVDPALAVETRRKTLDRAAADNLRLFGTHLPFPALGRAKKAGDAYEFVPEPFAVN